MNLKINIKNLKEKKVGNIFEMISFVIITIYCQENIFSFDDYKYKLICSNLIKVLFLYLVYKFLLRIKKLKKIDYFNCILTIIFLYYYNFNSVVLYLTTVMIIILLLTYERKKELYIIFYKILSLICFIGLIEYLFFFSGIKFNLIEIQPMSEIKIIYKTIYLKSYFFVLLSSYGSILYRFQSVFGEPGTLGTLIGMLFLFDNNLKILKKERIILFLSGLLSLSTAFFIMIIFKFISYPCKIINKIKLTIVMIIILVGVGQLVKIKNDSLYEKTFERVLYAPKKNNRESNEAKIILKEFLKTEKSIFGTGKSFPEDYPEVDVSSWRLILYEKGYVGFIVLILYFLYITKFTYRNIYIKLSIIFFFMSVYQRPNILTPANVLILLTGINYAENYYKK